MTDSKRDRRRPPLQLPDRLARGAVLTKNTRVHLEIWLTHEERGPVWLEAMEGSPLFMLADFYAQRTAAVVGTWALLEDRKDTISIPRLAKDLAAEGLLTTAEAVAMGNALLALPAHRKFKILRHECFSHRSNSISVNALFKEVGLSPNEARELSDSMLASVEQMLTAAQIDLAPLDDAAAYARAAFALLA